MTATTVTTELSELIEAELRTLLGRLNPDLAHVCGYALGYWDRTGSPQRAVGKGFRGTLALLSARAAGAPPDAGLPAAVAVELVHNFSLIHDDLMDADVLRRHRRTVWAEYGTGAAVLAGDAMLGLAIEVLAETAGSWAVQCLSSTVRHLIAGQQADLAFERRDDVTLAECITMAEGKTGSLLACAASLGAVVVDGPPDLACALAAYGKHLGLAFQLGDDILGIWGRPEVTGKPVLSDLRSRKKSLPVVAALTGPHGAALNAVYSGDQTLSEAELAEVAELIERAGGRDWAERTAADELAAAVNVLSDLSLTAEVEGGLIELAHRLAGREC